MLGSENDSSVAPVSPTLSNTSSSPNSRSMVATKALVRFLSEPNS